MDDGKESNESTTHQLSEEEIASLLNKRRRLQRLLEEAKDPSKKKEDPGRDRGKWRKGYSGNPSTKFKPGNCANPLGKRYRPSDFDVELRRMMEETSIEIKNGDGTVRVPLAEAMAQRAYEQALKGDFRFWMAIVERCCGKVPQQLDITKREALTEEEEATMSRLVEMVDGVVTKHGEST